MLALDLLPNMKSDVIYRPNMHHMEAKYGYASLVITVIYRPESLILRISLYRLILGCAFFHLLFSTFISNTALIAQIIFKTSNTTVH